MTRPLPNRTNNPPATKDNRSTSLALVPRRRIFKRFRPTKSLHNSSVGLVRLLDRSHFMLGPPDFQASVTASLQRDVPLFGYPLKAYHILVAAVVASLLLGLKGLLLVGVIYFFGQRSSAAGAPSGDSCVYGEPPPPRNDVGYVLPFSGCEYTGRL